MKTTKNYMQNENKRAQVTLFVILGIVLVSAILIFFAISKVNSENGISKPSRIEGLKENVQDCLKNVSIDTVSKYGLSKNILEPKISSELTKCASSYINEIKKQYEITSELKSVSISVSDKEILIVADYPITSSTADSAFSVSVFSYSIPRESSISIDHDINCRVLTNEIIYSFDEKMKIFIPEGTIAKDKFGNCLNNLSIKIDDPVVKYGDRSTSLTAIIYTPTEGATFSEGAAEIDLYYSDLDYAEFLLSSKSAKAYQVAEEDLSILYYDSQDRGFFFYSDIISRSLQDNLIRVRTTRFFDGTIRTTSSCVTPDIFSYESYDKRVILKVDEGTVLKESSGSCMNNVGITMGPKSSNVVNFGDRDYNLYPDKATLSPSVSYTYRYTQEQINSPVFKYGYHNWEDLITGNWTDPSTSLITGNAIMGGSLRSRRPNELRVAFLEEPAGIYRPYTTKLNTQKKTITAQITHFSLNIPAMGCPDTKYIKVTELTPIETMGGEDTKTYGFKVTKNQVCETEQGVFPSAVPTEGDEGEISEGFDSSCTGDCTIGVMAKDTDNTLEDGSYYAYTDVYARIIGIGIEAGRGTEITREEYMNATSMLESCEDPTGNPENFCCDEMLDVCGEDLCSRCAKDMGCEEGQGGWECSTARVNGCVSDNSCAVEEPENMTNMTQVVPLTVPPVNSSILPAVCNYNSWTGITNPTTAIQALDLIKNHRASFLLDNAELHTMNMLSPLYPQSSFESTILRLKNKGDDTVYLYLINQGDGDFTPQSFYTNDQIGGQVNSSKVSAFKTRLEYINSQGMRIVFWVRADDSREMMAQSITNYQKYHQDVVTNFDSYAAGYVIGLESNEYMNATVEQMLISDLQNRTTRMVGVHYTDIDTYISRARSSGADIWYTQHGWGKTCMALSSEVTHVISQVLNMKIVAAEYDKSSVDRCGCQLLQAGAIGYGNG